MKIRTFVSKNLVAIVMVPAIIASHYGWLKLQENNSLVSPEERKKLAIYSVFFFNLNYVVIKDDFLNMIQHNFQ